MSAKVEITYSEMLDHWLWEVTVNGNSVYSVDASYEDALYRVRDTLEDMLEAGE